MVEVIVALSLLSILVLAMLPVLTSTLMQLNRLEETRLQNQFLRNVITCTQQQASISVGETRIDPTAGLEEGSTNTFTYRGVEYRISSEIADDVFRYVIEREGMDEPIRLLRTE